MEQCPVDRSIVSVCPLQELFHPHVGTYSFTGILLSHAVFSSSKDLENCDQERMKVREECSP